MENQPGRNNPTINPGHPWSCHGHLPLLRASINCAGSTSWLIHFHCASWNSQNTSRSRRTTWGSNPSTGTVMSSSYSNMKYGKNHTKSWFSIGSIHVGASFSTCGGDGIRDGLNPKKARISMGKSMVFEPSPSSYPQSYGFRFFGKLV